MCIVLWKHWMHSILVLAAPILYYLNFYSQICSFSYQFCSSGFFFVHAFCCGYSLSHTKYYTSNEMRQTYFYTANWQNSSSFYRHHLVVVQHLEFFFFFLMFTIRTQVSETLNISCIVWVMILFRFWYIHFTIWFQFSSSISRSDSCETC